MTMIKSKETGFVPPDLLREMAAMFKNNEYCDVTLRCADGIVAAPGLLLASVCPVIRKLGVYLTSEMEASIILPDLTSAAVAHFIENVLSPDPVSEANEVEFRQMLTFFSKEVDPASFDSSIGKNFVNDRAPRDEEEDPVDVFGSKLECFPVQGDEGVKTRRKSALQTKSVNNVDNLKAADPVKIDRDEDYSPELKIEESVTDAEDDDANDAENDFIVDDDEDGNYSDELTVPSKTKRVRKKKVKKGKLSAEAKATYDDDLKVYVCPKCNLRLKAGMTNHLKWHKDHPDEVYPSRATCEHCGKTFKKIGILRAHIIRMHSNMPKQFKCTYEGCGRAFKMKGELNTHFLIHTDCKNFICSECGFGFRTKMALDSHTLRKHTNLKPSIPCEECGKLFKVRSDLYSHAMTHKARKERVHRCNECNLTFRSEKSLARHRELHDPTRPLACPKCPLRYKNKDQLVRHIATHDKPEIECDLCHRVFGRPDHLKRHIVTKHASLPQAEQLQLAEKLNRKKNSASSQPVITASAPVPPVSSQTITITSVHNQQPLSQSQPPPQPPPLPPQVQSLPAAVFQGLQPHPIGASTATSSIIQSTLQLPLKSESQPTPSEVAVQQHQQQQHQPISLPQQSNPAPASSHQAQVLQGSGQSHFPYAQIFQGLTPIPKASAATTSTTVISLSNPSTDV